MTRAVAQTPSDLVLSSTTESQEAIEHAVSENWKEPFVPAAEKKAADEAAIAEAKRVLESQETPEQKTAREAKEAETEHAEETPEQRAQRIADEAEPVKGNWSKRVNKLTARNARIAEELRTERESREKLETRLAALERGEKPGERPADSASVPDLPNKPKRIDFTDEAQYVEKLIQWTKANEDYREGVQEANEHAKEVFIAHGERIEEARNKYDDWDTVAKGAVDMILPPAVDFAIREMPNSADVLYHLAKNRTAFEKMSQLSPYGQVAEAVRISDRLAAANGGNGNGKVKKTRPTVTEPITPGGRRTTATPRKLEDITDTDEYIRQRRAMRMQRRAN